MNFRRPGESDDAYELRIQTAKDRAREREVREAETQGEVTIESIRAKFPPSLTRLGGEHFCMEDDE